MTAEIFMENGQVLHRSNYRLWIQDELLDKDVSDAQEQFNARVYEMFGFQILP